MQRCAGSTCGRSRRWLTLMPEGDTIRRLAERINQRFAGQRCTRCVTRDPRLVGLDLAGADAARCRCPRQAPADPLRRRAHAVRPPAPRRLLRRRPGGRRSGVAAAGRAVDGRRPAHRCRRADPRRRRHGQRGQHRRPPRPRSVRTRAPRPRRRRRPDGRTARRAARRRAARPAQRRRVRQRLRRRAAVHRRRVAAPADRDDRRPAPGCSASVRR